MKKPAWASMPVLDVTNLPATTLDSLAQAYDTFANKELAPIAQLTSDPVRIAIDTALCAALGLPDLSHIRALLAREPGLSARDIHPRAIQMNLIEDDDEEDEQIRMTLN